MSRAKASPAKRAGKAAPKAAPRFDLPGRRPPRAAEREIDLTKLRGFYAATGYKSASTAVRDGRSPTSGSGDVHLKYDREQLVNQSRDFARDNGIYRGIIDRATAYIVGNGFGLQAKTDDPKWNARIEAWWKTSYWRRPEIRGLLSGRRVERQVCKELLTAGDVGVLQTNVRGKLQLIESEQIAGPSMVDDGLLRDDTGEVTGFMIAPYGRGGAVQRSDAKRVGPEAFLFLSDPERPSSARAVPPCQASFAMLHRINDVCDSEAIAWQLMARMAVAITKKDASLTGQQVSTPDPDLEGSDTSGKLTTRLLDFDYGTVFWGEEGEEIKGIERNIPGQNFEQSLTMFLRLLGLPLGLPLEIVLLDWTKSNYSQSRAVLEQAYVSFLGWQLLLEEGFYQPVYRWAVEQAIEEKVVEPKPDRFAHDWIKPTFPWIDQLAEAQAYGAKLDRALCTHAQVLKSLNLDREDVVAAREREIRDAIGRAKAISRETGVQVPWQHFAGLPYSVNEAPAPAAGADPAKNTDEEDE